MLSVSRKEVKFLVSSTDRVYLLNSLSQILVPDKYGDYNGYKTRSIYFDSIDNEDFREKQIKTEKRKRIRVRIYNEEDKFAKFEIKRKHFERELKESITITKEDAIRLINREYSVLLNYKDNPLYEYAFNLMKSKLYRPVSMVEYDRRAFTHEFFNPRVTYDRFLFQQLQEVLSKCNFVGKPPSKFGTSRQLLNTYYY